MYLGDKVIIADNFYKDPYKVREIALAQDYKDCKHAERDGNWPGYRSKYLNHIDEDLCQEFRSNLMTSLLDGVPTYYNCYFETNFQICCADHGDSWIHTDIAPHWDVTHVGVVYLNPAPLPNSGTIFYRFKEEYTDAFKEYSEKHNGLWTALTRDQDSDEFNTWFEEVLTVPNRFNRAIIYSPHRWHKSDQYFGDSIETGRMIQPFFATIEYSQTHNK
jgi:hypothetical protein